VRRGGIQDKYGGPSTAQGTMRLFPASVGMTASSSCTGFVRKWGAQDDTEAVSGQKKSHAGEVPQHGSFGVPVGTGVSVRVR
jgi:hypothetical protein